MMFAGTITVSYAHRREIYQAGDAIYMPPGHVPAAEAGTEFIQFSPQSSSPRRSRRCEPARSGRHRAGSFTVPSAIHAVRSA